MADGSTKAGMLALGTAQFGLDYGISNAEGKPPQEQAHQVIARACAAGISLLDTASAYGDAEAVIGRCADAGAMAVVTKTPRLTGDSVDRVTTLETAFAFSLARLGRSRVHGLLIHQPADLDGKAGDAVWSAMREIKESGRAAKLGVSVYARSELDAVLDRFEPDLVQLPLSLLDQRALRDGTIEELRARGIEIHARSLFLQGLIFLPLEGLAPYFAPIAGRLADLHQAIGEAGSTPLAAALHFGCRSGVDRIVVGVQSVSQLEESLAALETELDIDYSRFAVDDPLFVEPRRWNLG